MALLFCCQGAEKLMVAGSGSPAYDGPMNTTANATATRRRAPLFIPKTIDLDQLPAVQRKADLADITPFPMEAGDRISVKIINYRGELTSYGHNYTLGSVAEYAARYGNDVEARVALSKERGENLYYAIAEAVVISAHPQAPVKRLELEMGSVIEMDGQRFQILQSPNDNLQLVPFPAN